MAVTIEGKAGIKATILKDSISPSGVRLITFELEYPRMILAEVNTHCMLEKNSASSRAIPVDAMLKLIEESPAMPVEWGANNPGMVSKKLLDPLHESMAKAVWSAASKTVVAFSRVLGAKDGINAHKQIANRLSETFQFMKTVMTGTEWDNFFWLRYHPDADPTFQELARCMFEAREKSVPELLYPGEWHLPYVTTQRLGEMRYMVDGELLTLDQAKRVSASCCAQASYRKLNDTLEQADKVFGMLNLGSTDKPAHASPVAHQATPMQEIVAYDYPERNIPADPDTWEAGVTHMRKDRSLWSGKLRNWVQYRQLIPNEAKWSE